MSGLELEQLCQLVADGRLTDAISLIREEIGATALELSTETNLRGGWVILERTGVIETSWKFPLLRRGVICGWLVGEGPQDDRVPLYAKILTLGVSEPTPLARVVLETSEDAFWTQDLETEAFTATNRLLALLELESVALYHITDILPPAQKARYRAELEAATARGAESFESVFESTPSDGRSRTLRMKTVLTRFGTELIRLSGTVTDVTAEEQNRRHLAVQRQELQARAALAVELAELVTRLIHAQDEREVETLGAVAFASMLGVEQAAFVRSTEDGFDLRLHSLGITRKVASFAGSPLAELLQRQESIVELELSAQRDELSTSLRTLGFSSATAFALDAGASMLGMVLALDRGTRPLTPDERVTGVQLAVMLAVALARLDDQAKVLRSERQLEHALALTRSGSWSYEPRKDTITWSRELSRINGHPAQERQLSREESMSYTHPDDRELDKQHYWTLFSEQGTHSWTSRIIKPDGKVEHRRIVAVAELNPEGQVVRLSGVSSDVTSEVEAQAGLQAALARASRYQTLFSLSETLSAIFDADGSFIDVSPTWNTALGWPLDEMMRHKVHDFVHEEDRPATVGLNQQAIVSGRSFSTVNRFRTKDGEWRILAWNAVPDPATGTIYAVAHDITSLSETKERLERNEDLFRRAGALAHIGGWEFDSVTQVLIWNEEIRRIHDVEPTFVPTLENWLFFFDAASRPSIGDALRRCLDEGEPFDLEAGLITARGAQVWVRAQGQAVGVGTRATRIFGAFQDITAQREAREAVLQASRAKSQFLANTSHEIRTPLNGILGMTRLALETALSPEQTEYMEAVQTSGENLLAIVNDILDISKIESGKMELEEVPFSLQKVVFEAVRNQATRAHTRGLELVARVDGALSSPVMGDPVRLGQIVTNLVGNSVKFTEKGEVVVEAWRTAKGLELQVRDTGVGIPPDRIEAIFEAFTQGDGSTNRKFGGTGLGLTITRELVERMGGHIHAQSTPGHGSTFTVELPLREATGLALVARRARPATRVLVVDDSAPARAALGAALGELGAQVTEAPSPDSAMQLLLEAFEQGRAYDVLIAELSLTGTTGIELCEALDNHDGLDKLPRLLLHSTVERPLPEDLARAHVGRTLTKPVLPWDLEEALDALTGFSALEALDAKAPAAPSRAALHILLAEDNAINARLAVRLLEKLGHTVQHVTDGQLAVEALQRAHYDAVLMDMQMPRLDGLDATRKIRASERGARVPVIALTANAMKGDDALCFAAGMDGYLTKPIDLERLKEMLGRHVPDGLRATGRIA